MADTFTYVPSRGIQSSSKPRVTIAQFGDGYSQRKLDGINAVVKEWNLNFINKENAEAEAILAFFETKAGAEAFLWTPPYTSTQYKVICTEWSYTQDSHIAISISAKFTQVFDA